MCGKRHTREADLVGQAFEGQTVKLSAPSAARHCAPGGFPWWTLWLLWPLLLVLKSLGALTAPLLALLVQPVTLTVAPLVLLLVGAGLILLWVGRRHDER